MNSFDSQVLQVASSAPFLGLAQEAFEALGPKTPRWKLSFEVDCHTARNENWMRRHKFLLLNDPKFMLYNQKSSFAPTFPCIGFYTPPLLQFACHGLGQLEETLLLALRPLAELGDWRGVERMLQKCP